MATSVLMRSSPDVLAAPNMMFWNGTYFLAVETFESGQWRTRVFESDQVFSGFTEVPDNPLPTDGGACFFQHIFDDVMHAYYCKLTGTTWTLEHRSAPLLAGRTPVPGEIDQTKWEILGGSWSRQMQVRHDGVSSNVAQAVSSADNTLMSLYGGTDYVLEGFGRLEQGRVWGLNVRVIETGQIYTSNLYEDLDGTDNLYLYRFHPLTADEALATSTLGPVAYDDWYEMKVSAHGDTLDVYLDGDYKHTGTDLLIPTGAIGLYGEVQTVAYFEDIRVHQYAAAAPTVALMLGPQVPLLFDAGAGLFLSVPAFILVALMIAVANAVSVRRGR